jgi:hypothetical protein
MKNDFKDIINLITALIGLVATIIGLIKIIIEFLKNKQEKNVLHVKKKINKKNFVPAIIYFLVGVILLFVALILFHCYRCTGPRIEIEDPLKNAGINEIINVSGKTYCISEPTNYKIILLIHRFNQNNRPEKWFIHPQFIDIMMNDTWEAKDVEVGTCGTKGFAFEIAAFVVSLDISQSLFDTLTQTDYIGSSLNPIKSSLASDKKVVQRLKN